jgi:Bacterial regulatory helix-turn-helix protein, lysR family
MLKVVLARLCDNLHISARDVEEFSSMARRNTVDLIAFLAVARERSFTRAAASLGVSPSALNHTMRGLRSGLAFSS